MTKNKRPESYVPDEDELFDPNADAPSIWDVVNPIIEHLETPECKPWIDMCAAVDKQADFEPLMELIEKIAPPEVIPFVRDLFERRKLLKGSSGRKTRTPRYQLSRQMTFLYMAVEEAKDLVSGGIVRGDVEIPPYASLRDPAKKLKTMKVEDAIKQISEKYASFGVTENALTLAYEGRHRHLNEELRKAKIT